MQLALSGHFSSLVVLAVGTQGPDKVSVIKLLVDIAIVLPYVIKQILLVYIGTEVETAQKASQVISGNIPMSILINTPEYFEHAVVLETHQLLLEGFNFTEGPNLFLEYLGDAQFNIM